MPPDAVPGPADFELLPWQRPLWDSLQQARRDGRLHHALLITGLAGTGKARFARAFAQSLLCNQPDPEGMPCGECSSCHWLRVGTHPDYQVLEPDPESKSGEIKIDAIRELSLSESLSAHAGGYKLTVIAPAERMNLHASNALLKTLEEPTAARLFMLLSVRPNGLSATVRSRCQHIHVPVPAEGLALEWLRPRWSGEQDCLLALRLSNGAPLAALTLMGADMLRQRENLLGEFLELGRGGGNPVSCAAAWMKLDLPLLFEWMAAWVADMLRLGAGQGRTRLCNPDHGSALAEQAARIETAVLHRYWQRLTQARTQLSSSNLNPQLLLETLLSHWHYIGARGSHGRT